MLSIAVTPWQPDVSHAGTPTNHAGNSTAVSKTDNLLLLSNKPTTTIHRGSTRDATAESWLSQMVEQMVERLP
jgi:hypothetical protein